MVQENLLFDPKKDLHEVDQFGWIDLREAISNGVVDGLSEIDQEKFNDIEDPRAIMGKPRDTFEAMRMAHEVRERGKVSTPDSQSDGPKN